jgi:arylformamidase
MTDRRSFLCQTGAAVTTATALTLPSLGLAEEANEDSAPRVWLDMTQAQLDSAYDQRMYAPNMTMVMKRIALQAAAARARLGEPEQFSYGESSIERLFVYRSGRENAPVQVFIHGGAWHIGAAEGGFYKAEPIVNAGGHAVFVDFADVDDEGVSLADLARQVRDAVAWTYRNAGEFGGNRDQLFVSGHSSGGHLAGVILTTDWVRAYGLPPNIIKGGVCSSGMFDLEPVRLSKRDAYLHLTDQEEYELSPQRHIDKLSAPVIVAYATEETPEFKRQSQDFAAAVKAAGKPVRLLVAAGYNHVEFTETYANPFGFLGRALLEQMGLDSAES